MMNFNLFFQKADIFLLETLNSLAEKSFYLDVFFVFFSEYFGYFLIGIFFLFLLRDFQRYRLMVPQALVSAVFSRFALTELIRLFVPRERPFVGNNVTLLFNHPATNSFPSGHAAFFFGLSTVIFLYNKKAGILFFFASFLISISRVISGVHWPSDIIAGAAVGIFTGWLIFYLSKIFQKKDRRSV